MDRQGNILQIGTHFESQRRFGQEFACTRSGNRGAQQAFRGLVPQQLGQAIPAPHRQVPARSVPWKY